MTRNQITDPATIRRYIFGGRSTFTIVSKKSGKRFTYKISTPADQPEGPFFVRVLTGSDNENDFTYAGFIPHFNLTNIIQGRKGRVSWDAPSMIALRWVLKTVEHFPASLDKIEFWHEGKCCVCGRKLTVPESIESGIGPVCASREV